MEVKYNMLSNAEQCLIFLSSSRLRKEVSDKMICTIDESIKYKFESVRKFFSEFLHGYGAEPKIKFYRGDFNNIYLFALALKESNAIYSFLDEALESELTHLIELLEAEEVEDIKVSISKVEPSLENVLMGIVEYLKNAYNKVDNERELVKFFFESYRKNVDTMDNCYYNSEEEALYRYTKQILK